MHSVKLLALILAVILIISISTSQLPVEAQQNSKTELTLGIKKNIDGHPEGSEENAIPAIIHVEQTYLIYGRLMQIQDDGTRVSLQDAEVKLIDVFNNVQNPVVLTTAKTDNDGYCVFEWKVSAKKLNQIGAYEAQEGITSLNNIRLQVFGIYEGDSTHAKSTSIGYNVKLKPLRLIVDVETNKTTYDAGESAQITITFKDSTNQLTDPDTLEVFFKSLTMLPVRQEVGVYSFITPPLAKNTNNNVVVLADKENYLREIISSTVIVSAVDKIFVDLNVKYDQDTYGLGDFVTITGTVRPVMTGNVVLIKIINPNGVIFNFGQVVPNIDGIFEYEFRLSGKSAITGEWNITYNYLGSQVIDSLNVVELPTKSLQIIIQSQSVVNDLGEMIDKVQLGSPVGIQAKLTNNEKSTMPLTYIVVIKDSEDFTVMISWIKSVIKPNVDIKPTIFWIPENKGNYNVELFIWESFKNPIPLSDTENLNIIVV